MNDINCERDLLIWSALKKGDLLAFGDLYQMYFKPLYNYGFKLCGKADFTEDCIHDLFVDLWRMRDNLAEKPASVKFYLLRSLRRKIHWNTDNSLEALDENAQELRFLPSSNKSDEEEFNTQMREEELLNRLRKSMQELPPRQREVVMLRYYENMSVTQISFVMGIHEPSVRKLLHKAMGTIRRNHLPGFSPI